MPDNHLDPLRYPTALRFLRKQKMQVRDGNGLVQLCAYEEPDTLSGFHWVRVGNQLLKAHEDTLTILL